MLYDIEADEYRDHPELRGLLDEIRAAMERMELAAGRLRDVHYESPRPTSKENGHFKTLVETAAVLIAAGGLILGYRTYVAPPHTTCTPNAIQLCGASGQQSCAIDGSKWLECATRPTIGQAIATPDAGSGRLNADASGPPLAASPFGNPVSVGRVTDECIHETSAEDCQLKKERPNDSSNRSLSTSFDQTSLTKEGNSYRKSRR